MGIMLICIYQSFGRHNLYVLMSGHAASVITEHMHSKHYIHICLFN